MHKCISFFIIIVTIQLVLLSIASSFSWSYDGDWLHWL